jgi:hypothetical protein
MLQNCSQRFTLPGLRKFDHWSLSWKSPIQFKVDQIAEHSVESFSATFNGKALSKSPASTVNWQLASLLHWLV